MKTSSMIRRMQELLREADELECRAMSALVREGTLLHKGDGGNAPGDLWRHAEGILKHELGCGSSWPADPIEFYELEGETWAIAQGRLFEC